MIWVQEGDCFFSATRNNRTLGQIFWCRMLSEPGYTIRLYISWLLSTELLVDFHRKIIYRSFIDHFPIFSLDFHRKIFSGWGFPHHFVWGFSDRTLPSSHHGTGAKWICEPLSEAWLAPKRGKPGTSRCSTGPAWRYVMGIKNGDVKGFNHV